MLPSNLILCTIALQVHPLLCYHCFHNKIIHDSLHLQASEFSGHTREPTIKFCYVNHIYSKIQNKLVLDINALQAKWYLTHTSDGEMKPWSLPANFFANGLISQGFMCIQRPLLAKDWDRHMCLSILKLHMILSKLSCYSLDMGITTCKNEW